MCSSDLKVSEPKLRSHPLLEKLEPGAKSLSGYVRSRNGKVQLYPTLSGLDQYIEFNEEDVLHHEENTDLPNGGTTVWLKSDSIVTAIVSVRIPASSLTNRTNPKRSKLYLSMETIRALTDGAMRRGDGLIPVTDACLSGENRCTRDNSDCTGCGTRTTWIDTDAGCTQTLGAATCGSVNLSCMGAC